MQTLVRDKFGRFASKSTSNRNSKSRKVKIVKQSTTLKNHVIILLDKSGSMSHLTQAVRDKSRELLQEIKNNSDNFNQWTEVSLYQFDGIVDCDYVNKNIGQAVNDGVVYNTRGSTALLSALHRVISDGKSHQDYTDKNVSYLVMVLTDGQENASIINKESVLSLIREVNATDRWSITFQCPHGCKRYLEDLGIASGNIREWEGTLKGFQETMQFTNSSINNYYNSRSLGETKTSGFYVQPDLTKVTKSDLRQLDDLSKQYRVDAMHLGKMQIRDFVQNVIGLTYVPGNVFYELVKTEFVSAKKQILVREKSTGKIYGGIQARNLIGLTDNKNHKVIPGNHGKYEIYPQSTSYNRILTTATKVLIKI